MQLGIDGQKTQENMKAINKKYACRNRDAATTVSTIVVNHNDHRHVSNDKNNTNHNNDNDNGDNNNNDDDNNDNEEVHNNNGITNTNDNDNNDNDNDNNDNVHPQIQNRLNNATNQNTDDIVMAMRNIRSLSSINKQLDMCRPIPSH